MDLVHLLHCFHLHHVQVVHHFIQLCRQISICILKLYWCLWCVSISAMYCIFHVLDSDTVLLIQLSEFQLIHFKKIGFNRRLLFWLRNSQNRHQTSSIFRMWSSKISIDIYLIEYCCCCFHFCCTHLRWQITHSDSHKWITWTRWIFCYQIPCLDDCYLN